MTDSFIRLFEAGQSVVLDRVDLARFDFAQIAIRTLRAAALVAVGAVWLAGAWFALLAGAVVWSLDYVSLPIALAGAAVLSVTAGAIAVYAGVQRATDIDAIASASALRAASAESRGAARKESRNRESVGS